MKSARTIKDTAKRPRAIGHQPALDDMSVLGAVLVEGAWLERETVCKRRGSGAGLVVVVLLRRVGVRPWLGQAVDFSEDVLLCCETTVRPTVVGAPAHVCVRELGDLGVLQGAEAFGGRGGGDGDDVHGAQTRGGRGKWRIGTEDGMAGRR